MRALGCSFQKDRIRLVELTKDKEAIHFTEKQIVNIDCDMPLPELCDRYTTHFREILNGKKPDLVAARRIWESTDNSSSICQVMPVGLLALVCHELSFPFVSFTPQALTSTTAFGLEKGNKPVKRVDEIFGTHPPYWDDIHRSAVLVAWRALREAK